MNGCYFCHRTRPIENGTYTLMDFGHRLGIQEVCDDCYEKGNEAEEPAEWEQDHGGYVLVADEAD
jgi:hypothetical protein